MKIVYSGVCDIGLKRENNQDAMVMFSEKNSEVSLFVVADGMGGHTGGEQASYIITDTLSQWVKHLSEKTYGKNFTIMMESLEEQLKAINEEIFLQYNQDKVCGSTCVLLFIYKECYGIINVGDSRIYKKEGWKIRSVMKDDVWENSFEVQEQFSQKEIAKSPHLGKLLHAVGTKERLVYSSKTGTLKRGDTFLLCSDGLYKMCSEKKLAGILQFLSESKVEGCAKKMLSVCYKGGADDNVSIIVVKCVS